MAESQEEKWAELTCSICMEVFREPVSLPCQHSYCRQCLQLFASKTRDTTEDKLPEESEVRRLACPLCREEIDLGADGVASLPVDVKLAAMVDRSGAETVHDTPPCSMCESNNKSTAIKFCSTCDVLYCGECLSAMHPMRGPLRRHTVVPVAEYIAKGMGEERCTDGNGEEESAPLMTTCKDHGEKLSGYCFTCHALICDQCVLGHGNHKVEDITTAVENLKDQLSDIDRECADIKVLIFLCKERFGKLKEGIKDKEILHLDELDKAYKEAVQYLKYWRRNLAKSVEKRHCDWRMRCEKAMKELDQETQQAEKLSTKIDKLTTADGVAFLQNSTILIHGELKDHVAAARNMIDIQEKELQRYRQAVDKDRVSPKNISYILERFRGKPLSTPVMAFQSSGYTSLNVGENGSLITTSGCRTQLFMRAVENAITNGKFWSGKHYWEFAVCIDEVPSDKPPLRFTAGVSQNGYFNAPSIDSWGVSIEYASNEYTFSIVGGPDVTMHNSMLRSQPHRLGFYLDVEQGKLIVVDCNNDSLICSITKINTSHALVPTIRLQSDCVMPVRVVPCDSSTIPNVLRAILQA